MVKLRGPAFAEGAAGSIGGTLVFSNWRGRPYLKKLTAPAQPNPPQQTAARVALKFLSERWALIDPMWKHTWESYPHLPNLDLYHRYCQYNLQNWNLALPPSLLYPATRSGGQPTQSSWTITAQGRRAEHVLVFSAINDGWGALIFRDRDFLSTTNFDRVTHIVKLTTDLTYKFWEGPLAPGTYKYNRKFFTDDGELSSAGFPKTLVIA